MCCFWNQFIILVRSNCPEVFCKKRVLRNFAKLTRKNLCRSLFFNKSAGLRPVIIVAKKDLSQMFNVVVISLYLFTIKVIVAKNTTKMTCFNLTNTCLFKVNNRNTRKRYEICSTNFIFFSSVAIADFEKVNVSWECLKSTYYHV